MDKAPRLNCACTQQLATDDCSMARRALTYLVCQALMWEQMQLLTQSLFLLLDRCSGNVSEASHVSI